MYFLALVGNSLVAKAQQGPQISTARRPNWTQHLAHTWGPKPNIAVQPGPGLCQVTHCWDWLLALRLHVAANHRAMYKSEMRCLGCTAQTLVEALPHGPTGDGQPPKSNGTKTTELNLARAFLRNPEVFRLSPKISERLYKIT